MADASKIITPLIDQQENAQRENAQREGDDLQEKPDGGVQQADHHGRDQRGNEAGDVKARHKVGNNHQCDRAQDPMQEQSQVGRPPFAPDSGASFKTVKHAAKDA